MKVKTKEVIKFSMKISYEKDRIYPIVTFKLKAVQGESLLDESFKVTLNYQYGGIEGQWSSTSSLSNGELKYDSIVHPNFDAIFLGESVDFTKKVAFTLRIEFELKKNPPKKLEKLPQKLDKIFIQGNEFSDIKIVCDGRMFECHKIVLSCQSEVFKGMSFKWFIEVRKLEFPMPLL